MCTFFGVSRAAYYAWAKRMHQPDKDLPRMQLVQEAYQQSRQTYGYRRIAIWIRQHKGILINHKAVLRLMQKLQIRSIARKPRAFKKRSQLQTYHQYENILARDFTAKRPNQKWVTDITYVATQQGWAYLATIKDLYDGFIVAHRLGRRNSVRLVTRMLQQAQHKEKVTDGLLLHSDQGHQYTSHPYAVLTQQYNINPSMSRPGNCWDNAPMESFFAHLKEELLRHISPLSFEQAKELIADYIQFYNYERIQLKTRQTPYQTRCLSL